MSNYKMAVIPKYGGYRDYHSLLDWLNDNNDRINDIKFVLDDKHNFYVYYAGD